LPVDFVIEQECRLNTEICNLFTVILSRSGLYPDRMTGRSQQKDAKIHQKNFEQKIAKITKSHLVLSIVGFTPISTFMTKCLNRS
jgi:hypothetical protein